MRSHVSLLCALIGATLAAGTLAQQPAPSSSMSSSLGLVVFPATGQAPDKQAADEGECFAWSKGQTGVDPFAPPPAQPAAQASAAPPPPPPAATGARVRGAARAAAGAVVGEIADNDASKGAEVGAALGVMKGGAETRQARRAQQEQAQVQAQQQQQAATQQSQAAQQSQRDTFNKGFAACMEAKGYTVK